MQRRRFLGLSNRFQWESNTRILYPGWDWATLRALEKSLHPAAFYTDPENTHASLQWLNRTIRHGAERGNASERITKSQGLKTLGNSLGIEPEIWVQIQVLPLSFFPSVIVVWLTNNNYRYLRCTTCFDVHKHSNKLINISISSYSYHLHVYVLRAHEISLSKFPVPVQYY